MLGSLAAWVGEVAQSYFAPIILFPILLGLFVGLCIVGVMRLAQVGHRPTVIVGAILAAAIAAIGQHYVAYLLTYSSAHAVDGGGLPAGDLSQILRKMVPSFSEYMAAQAHRGRPIAYGYVAQGWAAWATWSMDAVLLMAAAVAVMVPALRVPYCNQCRTWYRTVRGGKIDLPTATRVGRGTRR